MPAAAQKFGRVGRQKFGQDGALTVRVKLECVGESSRTLFV